MAKVPYTVNVQEYVCTELETLRDMDKFKDYSNLLPIVERIQFHVNSMERAIYINKNLKDCTKKYGKDKKVSDSKFRKKMNKLVKTPDKGIY